MNEQYDTSKFTVKLPDGTESTVRSLTTGEAEQTICRLLTVIREVQIAQLVATDSINRKFTKAGIEIVK